VAAISSATTAHARRLDFFGGSMPPRPYETRAQALFDTAQPRRYAHRHENAGPNRRRHPEGTP
jgi:hypothetical protein